jgi:hypothetical protein
VTARRIGKVAVLLVAGAVFAAALTQAVREHSWAPLEQVGWIPAVLVASLYHPHSRRRREPHAEG